MMMIAFIKCLLPQFCLHVQSSDSQQRLAIELVTEHAPRFDPVRQVRATMVMFIWHANRFTNVSNAITPLLCDLWGG